MHEALVTAGRAVTEAQAAVRRASEVKGAEGGLGGGTSVAAPTAPAPISTPTTVTNDDGNRKVFFQPSRTAACGTYIEKNQHGGAPSSVSGATVSASSAKGVTGAPAGNAPCTTGDAIDGVRVGGDCGSVGDNIHEVQQIPFDPKSCIGFMRSSKVKVLVGGLLPTGGGRANTLDIAKSLVLRGCLRQKLGRTKQAEGDYRQALRICHSRLKNIGGGLGSHPTKPSKKGGDGHDDQSWVIDTAREEKTVTRGRKNALGGRGGQWSNFEKIGALDETTTTVNDDDVPREGCIRSLPPFHDTRDGCEDAVDIGNSSVREEGLYKVLKLESLIHHNLTTLHIASLLGTDNHVSFRKVGYIIVLAFSQSTQPKELVSYIEAFWTTFSRVRFKPRAFLPLCA